MIKQTFEDAVLKTVLWWIDKSFKIRMNQNNGDDSGYGALTSMVMNMQSVSAQDKITDEYIKKFENKLTELLMKTKSTYERNLNVDYHPCEMLFEAAKFAEINPSCFPCKSFTEIDENNKVFAKYGYSSNMIEL